MVDYGEDKMKMKKSYLDYVEALEEERKKILVFQRELPLCLHLVNQAIENWKQQVNYSLRSECEEEQTTSTESPFLEEFIPLKRSLSSEQEQYSKQQQHEDKKKKNIKNVDWMRSVQLWNQTSPSPPDHVHVYPPPSKQQESNKGGLVIESKTSGGAFLPFHKHKTNTSINTAASTKSVSPHPSSVATAAATSSTGDNSNKSREDKDAQGNRKARRCWSPELHKRFLQALQLLGGSYVATPKQITELMKVDGLTNDEVTSHLQVREHVLDGSQIQEGRVIWKRCPHGSGRESEAMARHMGDFSFLGSQVKYRLHTRRPAPSLRSNGNSQPTQFVVVGGMWVPPPEYSAAAASKGDATTPATPPKGVFVPVATPPQLPLTSCSQQHQQQQNQNQLQQQQQQRSPAGSRSSQHSVGDDNTHSDSPALTPQQLPRLSELYASYILLRNGSL